MFTRYQYLDGQCTHEQYYAQFVTKRIKQLVKRYFGVNRLKRAYAEDASFNTILLSTWDWLGMSAITPDVHKKLVEAGDYLTAAGKVCILKEAARQLVAEAK